MVLRLEVDERNEEWGMMGWVEDVEGLGIEGGDCEGCEGWGLTAGIDGED